MEVDNETGGSKTPVDKLGVGVRTPVLPLPVGKTLLVLFVNGYGTVAVVDGDGLKIPVTPVLRGTEVGFGLMPVPAGEVPFGRGKGTLGVKDPVITDVPGVEVTPCEVGEQ